MGFTVLAIVWHIHLPGHISTLDQSFVRNHTRFGVGEWGREDILLGITYKRLTCKLELRSTVLAI